MDVILIGAAALVFGFISGRIAGRKAGAESVFSAIDDIRRDPMAWGKRHGLWQ